MSKPRGSAKSWRERQEKDPYVQRARRDGWRSRAVYKLEEIDQKERLLRPGMSCVDLGAAPGSWSQYVTETLKGNARIVAIDLLPMDALPNTDFIQGDFTEDAVLDELRGLVGGQKVDLVLSDLAPNISGNRAIDQPRAMYLAELALDFAREVLAERGNFVIKLFQGAGIDPFITDVRSSFSTVKVRKPKASRAGSREVYLVARNYRL
jgi:23S rRNA (uridine2552-2'-O)-methyltransferase